MDEGQAEEQSRKEVNAKTRASVQMLFNLYLNRAAPQIKKSAPSREARPTRSIRTNITAKAKHTIEAT